MRKKLPPNNWPKIILATFLVVLSLILTNSNALAQGEGEGEASIETRQNKDQKQTETEAEETERLQKEDEEVCEEEIDGSLKISPGIPHESTDPYDPDNQYGPDGDSDGDGIPNSEDPDQNGDGIDDNVPWGEELPPACQDGDTAGYVVANEGIEYRAYADNGYKTIGIGHQITGHEPFPTDGTLTDSQVHQLYDADMVTAKNCARQSAADHAVNWGALTPERQTVLIDMSFNMGCGGGRGVAGFDQMWGNIREGQRGNSEAWEAAGDEILDSNYAGQVYGRAENNANIMRTSDEAIINQQISRYPSAQNFCGGATMAQKSLNLLALLLGPKIAEAVGLYVPVIEQDGPLLDKTEEIRNDTDKIRILSINICTHLRAIRRIQTRFETKEFDSEVGARRVRTTEIEKFRNAILGEEGLMQKGGTDSQGNPGPLYVTNLTDYQAEAKGEAENRILNDIANSNNVYKEEILRDIMAQEAYGFPFNTTITEEDLQKIAPTEETAIAQASPARTFALTKLPIIGHLAKPLNKLASLFGANPAWAADPEPTPDPTSSKEKWDIWLKLMEPRNNRYGSFMQAINQLEESKAIAGEDARDTYIAGQGFRDTRVCEEWVVKEGSEDYAGTGENLVCNKWKTIVPAGINRESYSSALTARLDQYVNDPGMGGTGPGNGPDATENATGKPSLGGGGAPGPGSVPSAAYVSEIIDRTRSDADVNIPLIIPEPWAPDPYEDPGVPLNNFNWTGFGDWFDSIMSSDDPPSASSLNWLNWFLDLLARIYKNQNPLIHFKIKNLADNQSLLYWASPNATNCTAGNDWLSQTDTASTTPKKLGDSLGKNGNLVITYPSMATTSLSVIYEINCQNINGDKTKSVIVEKR